MPDLLSVNTVALTILQYPMSWIELVGTLTYLWSVWLMARRRMLTWPVGIVSVVLYMLLFYQIHLYSDALEQIYYLFASAYGWAVWHQKRGEDGQVTGIRFSAPSWLAVELVVIALGSWILGGFMVRAHLLFPVLFPEPASYPCLDAFTTVASFVAMWLLARKRTESWVLWIVVDLFGIWLYYVKNVRLISAEYVLLLGLAVRGLFQWMQAGRTTATEAPATSQPQRTL